MAEITVELKGGFQGYISSLPIQDAPFNALVEMKNCFIFNGRLKKRLSFSYHSSSSILIPYPAYEVNEFYSERSGVARKLLTFYSDTSYLYFFNLTDGTTTPINVGTINYPGNYVKVGEINFATFNMTGPVSSIGLKFFLNSSSVLQTFPIGLPKPDAPTTVLQAGADIWSAGVTYPCLVKYRVTWVTDNGYEFVESNGNATPSEITISIGNQRVLITQPTPPTGYTNITHWRIYRLIGGIDTIYKLARSSVPIGQTTHLDQGDVIYPSLSDELPISDHSQVPANPTCLGYHGDRLWAGVASGRIYYSKVNSPAGSCQHFNSLQYFQVGDPSDEFIKFISFPSFLLIVKRKSMWVIEGIDASTFRLQQIMNMGAVSALTTILHNGYLYFINENGIWKTTLFNEPMNLALSIWPDFVKIKAAIFSSSLLSWAVIFDPKSGCLWFNFFDLGGSLNLFLLLSPQKDLFVGKFFDPATSITSLFKLVQTTDAPTIGFAKSTKLWFDNIAVFNALGYTGEVSFDILAKTGMLLPDQVQFQKKLFRRMTLYSNLTPESAVTNSTEVMTLSVALATTISFSVISSSVPFGGSVGSFKTLKIGRTDFGLSLQIAKTSANLSVNWEVGNIKLVFENVGNY